jgi:hypothetical protein
MNANPTLQIGLTGHFLLEAVNAETGERRFLAEFDNLITNGGLDRLGSAGTGYSGIYYVQVGTGSTAPANTDSALANYLAGTSRSFSYTSSYAGAPTYHTEGTYYWEFNQGAAAGNLSEIGVGWAASGSLFSRALIVDGGGSPTTITVAAIEFLAVTYKLRMYPPLTDVTGTITLDGDDYDYTLRAANVNGSSWGSVGVSGPGGEKFAYAYSGGIGAVTGAPSGTASALTISQAAYSSGSYTIEETLTASISQGNLTGGIDSVTFYISAWNGIGQYSFQCGFSPAIPKDNTMELELVFEITWARKP